MFRATSFIFPLIITKMRPSSFKSYFLGKTGSLGFFFSQLNMFATCSATKVSMAQTMSDQKILRKTGISKNRFFFCYPKMRIFHNTGKSLFNEQILSHIKSCTHKIMRTRPSLSKRHTDMARARGQTFERLKMPRKFP